MRRNYTVMTTSARGTSKTADEHHRGPSDTLTLRPYAGFAGFDRLPLAAIVAIASGGAEA